MKTVLHQFSKKKELTWEIGFQNTGVYQLNEPYINLKMSLSDFINWLLIVHDIYHARPGEIRRLSCANFSSKYGLIHLKTLYSGSENQWKTITMQTIFDRFIINFVYVCTLFITQW